jgi:hypothetical protein
MIVRAGLIASLVFMLASCRDSAHELSSSGSQEKPHPINDDHCVCNGGLQVDPLDFDFTYLPWAQHLNTPLFASLGIRSMLASFEIDRARSILAWMGIPRADRARSLTLVPSLLL